MFTYHKFDLSGFENMGPIFPGAGGMGSIRKYDWGKVRRSKTQTIVIDITLG